jgi:hypothetical protein
MLDALRESVAAWQTGELQFTVGDAGIDFTTTEVDAAGLLH